MKGNLLGIQFYSPLRHARFTSKPISLPIEIDFLSFQLVEEFVVVIALFGVSLTVYAGSPT